MQERLATYPATMAQPNVPGAASSDAHRSAIVTDLRQALSEQRMRAEAISCLLTALDEQQTRIDLELSAVIASLDHSVNARGIGWRPTSASESIASGTPNTCGMVVRCFGGLEVQIPGTTLLTWRSGKARAVFEYLVAHRRQPVQRDTLIQALWPDPEALASGTSLKVAVHALRQMVATSVVPGQPAPFGVSAQDSSYQIVSPGLWVDVEEFDRCCALAARLEALGQIADALALYERAAELYRGDFLPESWDDWAMFRREGLKDQYLFILDKLANAKLQAGDYQACIRLCRQLLEQDCCREDTFRMLMACHAYLSQHGRVKRWYQLCVKTLRTTLNTVPDPETVRMYEQACAIQTTARTSVRLTAL